MREICYTRTYWPVWLHSVVRYVEIGMGGEGLVYRIPAAVSLATWDPILGADGFEETSPGRKLPLECLDERSVWKVLVLGVARGAIKQRIHGGRKTCPG